MAARAEREVKIRFTGESAVLKGSAGEVRKVFQMMTSDLNDARGAGEKLAAAYEQVADSMRKDMKAISETADVVRDSLGPEMVQAIEASGRTVEDQVQAWRKLGLTLDDITRDSDQLAAGLKQLDDSARMSAGSVGDGFKKISTDADQSRSVMANFTGNAIQELPGVTGAMGPLNMAIGQFAEYAAEGNIKMKNLIATGAGMAAVSLAMSEMAQRSQQIAEAKVWRKENVDAFVDSIREGVSATDALVERFAEAGEIMVEFAGEASQKAFGGDLVDNLARAGLSVEQFATVATGGAEDIAALKAALEAAGATTVDVSAIVAGATQYQDLHNQALVTAAELEKVFGSAASDASDELDRGGDSLVEHMDATVANTLAQEALTTAFEEAEQAQRDLTAAQMASIDTGYAVADANDRFIESMEALAVAVDDPKTGVNELDQAQRAAEQSAIASAQAIVANAETMAAAAGAPLTARESNYLLIESLYATAASLGPNSPVGLALVEHINTLNGIQPTVATAVVVDVDDAHSRIGGLQTAVDDLDGTETNTESNAETDTALGAVEALSLAVEGVPGTIAVEVSLTGYTATMSQLAQLKTRLIEVKDEAIKADRAVGNVAG